MTTRQQIYRAKMALVAYNLSTDTQLSDCYGTYSMAKQRAYNYCINQMENVDGWGFRIISHNVNIFTCGYKYVDSDTGVIMFRYITPTYEVSVEWDI